jgi:hypothetical protein
MSQVPMTNPERVCALQHLGYTDQEGQFLCLAALHGGYFLRRQYAHFLDREDGGTVSQLIEKALMKEHAKASSWRRKVQVYHLSARPLYEAIGQPDNRNRRRRQPLSIKNKLMGLDFVLGHPDVHYLATEQEKVGYFVDTLQVPVAALPTKQYRAAKTGGITARYFVDKYPLFLSEKPVPGGSPVVSFCFVDEGQATLSHFETYLDQHGSLFSFLPQFCLVYVAANAAPFERAERMFERYLTVWAELAGGTAGRPEIRRLVRHFEARQQFEARHFASFDRGKLLRFRDERDEFSGPTFEAQYELWKAKGEPGLAQFLDPERPLRKQVSGSFSTHLLEYDYDIFGTVTAR